LGFLAISRFRRETDLDPFVPGSVEDVLRKELRSHGNVPSALYNAQQQAAGRTHGGIVVGR